MAVERPGCFGLPTAVSANSASCRSCPVQAACLFEAGSLLDTLPNNPLTQRERLSLSLTRRALAGLPQRGNLPAQPAPVATSVRGIQRQALSAAQEQAFCYLPSGLARQARELAARGWFELARSELRAGRNPAAKGWRRVFCGVLLTGGCSRDHLILALMEQLSLGQDTARVQVSKGLSLFAAGRIATEQGGHFALLPNQRADTTY